MQCDVVFILFKILMGCFCKQTNSSISHHLEELLPALTIHSGFPDFWLGTWGLRNRNLCHYVLYHIK